MATSTDKQQVKVTLYWLEKSRAHRILWLLEELNVNYELKIFKRASDMLAPPELKKIHPLGKSPIISVSGPGRPEPVVIAESGTIVEYLLDHFGPEMIPKRYESGKDGQVPAETEEWMRYRLFMHYAEGSLMPNLVIALIMNIMKGPMIPFLIRPITRAVANKIEEAYVTRNFETHFSFIEDQLATSPNGGNYLCGPNLTGADILMLFPLEAALAGRGLSLEKYPKIATYVNLLHEREAYIRSVKKVEEATGEKYSITATGS